jgi:hypothetical protein
MTSYFEDDTLHSLMAPLDNMLTMIMMYGCGILLNNERKTNMKTITSVGFLALVVACFGACELAPLCPDGQVQCGDSCMPSNASCCSSDGNYCNAGYVCGPDNTCIGGVTTNPAITTAESCLEMGQQPCLNTDGTIDCAALGRSCCGNHTSCPAGTSCIAGAAENVECAN